MVCSQVYSQNPSHCLLSVAHHHRSWGSSNAEMRLLEVETSERDCKGNFPYSSVSSPIKSSWIQRLIPSQNTRMEQPQFTNSMPIGRGGFNGLQANCSYDAVFNSEVGKQSDFALYENSRRSRKALSGRHEILLTKNTACNEQVEISAPGTSRICNLEVLQPKIQVPLRTLPVVECLLNPGCSKHVFEAQLSTETNDLHNVFKSSGFSNPIKQTVHFSADERCGVSCSSIEGLNSCRARCADGDSNASLLGDKCFNSSQPTLDFSFNHPEAALRSHVDSRLQVQTCTYSGVDCANGLQTEETIHAESRDPVSPMGLVSLEKRYRYDESRFLGRGVMPYNTSVTDSFMQANLSTTRTLEDLHVDQKSLQTARNRNPELSQEQQDHEKGATYAFEVSCGKGGAFTGDGCSYSGLGKDGSQRVSDLVSSQFKASTREKTGITLAPRVVEQDLNPSGDSHKEQDVTSGSFSFHSNSRLPYVSVDAKVALEKGALAIL
ncbi:hypothetical protein GOP47_0023292 [Adiantum capillus-veneris]|uniref:Uncharacterized protein n=1 Tax=Adiantum capillus-veneris TaxID=13818 RepID=A0A9D4Z533_ADICA|nr:hypothetical protein GOP47_0023292 [Adiantum capillus-veneris]